jgi:Na+-translocating ferredoxin:NAD+ oxidoreductase subunit C
VASVVERIARNHFWKFYGGIHPPEQKFLTHSKPIRQLSLPAQLIIPLQQHIGSAGELLVQAGDYVLKGQALTSSQHPMAVPVHAPTSGTISAIQLASIAHPSAMQQLCVVLAPDGLEQWRAREVCHDVSQFSRAQLINKIADAGIAGMGGAGFPTQIKVSNQAAVEFLIINAAECEPYITADDLLLQEHSPTVIDGIKILAQLLQPKHILIGIEDNKPQAIQAINSAIKALDHYHLCVVPTKYPTGGEKQLIQVLTGKEIPQGKLPMHAGIVMHNVATCFAIANAVINDVPLLQRVVTVTGQALDKPQNVWALLGTPVRHLLQQCGYQAEQNNRLIMGGPMMGFSLPSDLIPVVKTTNCILAPTEQEIPSKQQELECIRCGQCAEVCPSQLLPQELQWAAKAKDNELLDTLNLFDCIECGACAYVCPSQIPLVHYYRVAKADIRQQQVQEIKAEQAKNRFEARKHRLEQERIKREQKHQQAAEARRAKMNASSSDGGNAKSAVAAALARVKAKKLATNDGATTTDLAPSDEKSQVAAAIARTKAKKLAANAKANLTAADSAKNQTGSHLQNKRASDPEVKTTVPSSISTDQQQTTLPPTSEQHTASDNQDKKAKIAAAVQKAKQKAQQKAKEQETQPSKQQIKKLSNQSKTSLKSNVEQDAQTLSATEQDQTVQQLPVSREQKIKAAIAKAKAKMEQQGQQPIKSLATNNANDDKTQRIAAAIAKAKAKKQQAEIK